MSIKEKKAIVLDFYKAFDDRDIDRAFALLSPDFVAHMAGLVEPLNIEGFKQFGMNFYSAFTNGQHSFDEVIIEGEKVVTCGDFTARHTGNFQGLPPTQKQIKIAIMHIDRIEDGKIVEHWGQGDAQGLMQQLGIMFLPSPKLLLPILKNSVSRLFK